MKKLFLFFISLTCLTGIAMEKEPERGFLGSLVHAAGKMTDYDGWLQREETLTIYKRTRAALEGTSSKSTQECFDDRQFSDDAARILRRSNNINLRLEKAIKDGDTHLVTLILLKHQPAVNIFMYSLARKYLLENAVALKNKTQELEQLNTLMGEFTLPDSPQSTSSQPSPSTSPKDTILTSKPLHSSGSSSENSSPEGSPQHTPPNSPKTAPAEGKRTISALDETGTFGAVEAKGKVAAKPTEPINVARKNTKPVTKASGKVKRKPTGKFTAETMVVGNN